MRLYHRTTQDAADNIIAVGFKDKCGTYLTDREWKGVWLSDVPLDINDGPSGDVLLEINLDMPDHDLSEKYEWIEDGKTEREFLVPAKLINEKGRIRRVSAEEEEYIPDYPFE